MVQIFEAQYWKMLTVVPVLISPFLSVLSVQYIQVIVN